MRLEFLPPSRRILTEMAMVSNFRKLKRPKLSGWHGCERAGLRLRYDLDGDFAITREEVETTLRYEMRRHRGNKSDEVYENQIKNKLEQGILTIMVTDADGDGRLAGAEMSAPGKIEFGQFYLGEGNAALARAILKADPNGDGLLTKSETLEIWGKVFAGAKSP